MPPWRLGPYHSRPQEPLSAQQKPQARFQLPLLESLQLVGFPKAVGEGREIFKKVKSHNSTQKRGLNCTKDEDDCSSWLLLPLSTTAGQGEGSLGSGVGVSNGGSGQDSGNVVIQTRNAG